MPAFADNVVTVSSAEGRPGDEVEVTLSLTNTDAIVAAEVTIPLNEYIRYVDGSATLNAARANGHQLSAAYVDGALRLYVYGFGSNALTGNEGTLATFRLRLGKHPERFALTPQVILSNAQGQAMSATPRAGTATILAPELTITTSQIDFGHIPIRSTYTKTLTLKNTGTDVLTVEDVTFDAPELSASETVFTIASGATKSITLTFAPTKYGAISKAATIISDATNGKQTASIVADPYSVNELTVGNASGVSDTEVAISLTLKNMEPIMAVQCSFTLPDGLRYVEGSITPSTHAEGLSATASVEGKKLTLFLYSQSNVAIPEGNGEIATLRVLLDGKSGTYYMTPQDVVLGNVRLENMVSASKRGSVSIQSPTISCNASLDMGSTAVTEVAEKTYAIRNSGQVDLVVSNINFLAEGFSVKEELPLTIAKGTTKNITVCYTPSKEGTYRTTMNIYSNDPVSRLKNVAVSGSVYEPNSLSMTGQWADGNKKYVVSVALENYTDIVAAQMDVVVPQGLSLNTATALMPSERLNGLTSTILPYEGQTYRVALFSFSNKVIAGNSGNIFTLTFDVDDVNVAQGKTITIDNLLLSNSGANNYASKASCRTIVENAKVSIFALSAAETMGSVTGAGSVDYGTEVTLTAVPAEGCKFVKWSNDITENPYVFIATTDIEIKAEFVLLGDIYPDGTIDYKDVEGASRILLNQNTQGLNLQAADVDDNGFVTISDLTKIIEIINKK